MKPVNDNNPKTKRYFVNANGAGMVIRPALVTEVEQYNRLTLSVKYGSSRVFLNEKLEPFKKVVEECKEYERANNPDFDG